MLENAALVRLAQEGVLSVQGLLLKFLQSELFSPLLDVFVEGVALVAEFRKETAAVLEFDVAAGLDLAVKVGLDFAAAPLADVAGEEVARQVAEGVVVASAEGLLDPLFFSVREFVKH